MTALTGNTIASTYKDLLQVSNNNGGIDTTMRPVSDGEGTASALQINNAAVNINGTFQLNGESITVAASAINNMANIGSATGIIAVTGGDVYGRTLIAGTPVSITNANGTTGNPTITLASIAHVSGSYGPFTKFAVNDYGQIVSATDTEVSVSIATLRVSEVITETVCATSYVNIGGDTSIAGALIVNGIVSANNDFFIGGKLVAATEVSVVNQLNTSNLYAASAIIDDLEAGNLTFNTVSVVSFTANQLTVTGAVSVASLNVTGAVSATSLNITGVVSASTFEPTGDTASSDKAAIGYTSTEGLIATGQGSVSDFTLKNDADAIVFSVPTGSDDIQFPNNAKIRVGGDVASPPGNPGPAMSELEIYSDGWDAFITTANSASLNTSLNITTNYFSIKNTAGAYSMYAHNASAVGLFYNGSTKFSTSNTGITVTGTIQVNQGGIIVGGYGIHPASYDVKFYGGTNGSYMLWDESEDYLSFINSNISLGVVGAGAGRILIDSTTDTVARIKVSRGGASGTLAFHTGSDTEALRITSAGNVGIGTSSPAARLHVEGAAALSNLAILVNNTSTNGFSTLTMGGNDAGVYRNGSANSQYGGNSSLNMITVGAHPIAFSTSNTPRMTITSAGNVGIGTAAPAQILEVKDLNQTLFTGIRVNNPTGNVGQAGVEFQVDATYSKAAIFQKREAANGGGDLIFAIDSASDAADWALTDEKVRFTREGNVGIGTAAPASKLHLDGDVNTILRIDSQNTAFTAGTVMGEIQLHGKYYSSAAINTSYAASIIRNVKDSDDGTGGSAMTFSTSLTGGGGVTEKLRITKAGNVGIGTTAPATTLHVVGLITSTGSSTTTSGTSNFVAGVNAGNSIASGGNYNVVVGDEAGTAITTGDNNVAIGYNAGIAYAAQSQNTMVGSSAGVADTGANNTGIGFNSIAAAGTGANNTAVGGFSLYANSTGHSNVAIGASALVANTVGYSNVAVGTDALLSNTEGNYNTAVGRSSLDANTDGDSNAALGYATLSANTTGNQNVAVGPSAMIANISGSYNVAIGALSLDANTVASFNTAVGYGTLTTNTTGISNVAMGRNALLLNTTGGSNVAIGALSLDANTEGNSNVAVGYAALSANTTAGNNVAVGYETLKLNITGTNNTALGYQALEANTIGHSNVAVGTNALIANTEGLYNVAVGRVALDANIDGDYNTAVGYNALGLNTAGTQNVAVGGLALDANTTASYNTAVGYATLTANTTGASNVAMGRNALLVNTVGFSNVAIGVLSLAANTEGGSNTAIGRDAGGAVTTGDNNTFFGHDAGITGSPGGAITTADNQMCLGDENIANAHIQVDWTVASDKRDKTEVTPLVMGLDFINKLEPVTYRWDKRSKYSKDQDVTPDGTHKEAQLDVGFLAQDVEELEKEYGFNFEDKTNLTTNISDDEKMYGLKYSKFVPALVKAVQELTAKVKELEGKLV